MLSLLTLFVISYNNIYGYRRDMLIVTVLVVFSVIWKCILIPFKIILQGIATFAHFQDGVPETNVVVFCVINMTGDAYIELVIDFTHRYLEKNNAGLIISVMSLW